MGQRLTAIATRTGDDGSTGLGDGSRTSKDSLRVHAMGEVDELNSQLGVLRAQFSPSLKSAEPDALKEIDNLLHEIQHDLFDLGGELCIPGYEQLQAHQVLRLDVCRRAERAVVALAAAEPVRPLAQQYLNRLSDLLFVLARVLNRQAGGLDVLWDRKR
ncbi:MAG: ATP:cob(I)alamin adenosyltransferase [Betaproteobacteria bacterium]|nr:ATP:cob(I)alamin adenosyltransferase [Betaproteobacteria bacterium]